MLRDEIARLSRKEIGNDVDPTRNAAAQQRHEIRSLKRQVAQLEQQVGLLSGKVLATRPVAPSGQ